MMSLCDAISICLLCTSYLLPYILKVLQRKNVIFLVRLSIRGLLFLTAVAAQLVRALASQAAGLGHVTPKTLIWGVITPLSSVQHPQVFLIM
jgi:hypothetical protein